MSTSRPAAPADAFWTDPVVVDLMRLQHGVIARCQILGRGGTDDDIERWIRRRTLTVCHPGVYVDHTGPLTRRQREWVAVLACWPAALCHESALQMALTPGPVHPQERPVHVMVGRNRRIVSPPGVRVHRSAGFPAQVEWNRSPPRQRVDEAAIDVASGLGRASDRFEAIASVVRARMTTPGHLGVALRGRARIAGRHVLAALIDDLATGAGSALEHEYLRLERVHGLPAADRQRRDELPGGVVYRDAPYPDYGLIVELDGRAHHDTAAARNRDAERDLDTRVADDSLTVRLTSGQVWDRGCATVGRVATLLMRRGWSGPFIRCPDCAD